MELGLRDRVCVVTASTGGIGLETARQLVQEGARVVTSGRRAEGPAVGGAPHVCRDLGEPGAPGGGGPAVGEALHVSCDLGEPGAPEALVDEVVDRLGRVDCLVNNVGDAYQA